MKVQILFFGILKTTSVYVVCTISCFVEKSEHDDSEMLEKRKEQGLLLGSGLIAGEGIMEVLIAAYAFFAGKPQGIGWAFSGTVGGFVALGVFGLLGFYLVRKTRVRS